MGRGLRSHARSQAPSRTRWQARFLSAELARRLTSYRGGLTAAERRRIEAQLYDGTLRGVTATSTLELGVDIAALEAVVILGFPGSLSSVV